MVYEGLLLSQVSKSSISQAEEQHPWMSLAGIMLLSIPSSRKPQEAHGFSSRCFRLYLTIPDISKVTILFQPPRTCQMSTPD